MPKLKPSRGVVVFTTPMSAEFIRWLQYELFNSAQWNKKQIKHDNLGMQYSASAEDGRLLWTADVRYNPPSVKFTSEEPVIYVRKGLLIRMSSGQLILDGKAY